PNPLPPCTLNRKIRNPNPETRNPKPGTRSLKPEPPTPNPATRNQARGVAVGAGAQGIERTRSHAPKEGGAISGLWIRVSGGISGLWIRISGLRIRVWGGGVSGLWTRVSGFGFPLPHAPRQDSWEGGGKTKKRIQIPEIRIHKLGTRHPDP
ncbi:hypothetical protein T484DRAFT_1650167, partial [Baffinella frigidus]